MSSDDIEKIRTLWMHVLLQAIRDAKGNFEWFNSNNKDFLTICELANINHRLFLNYIDRGKNGR